MTTSPKPLKIREGRYYARADGSVHGPMIRNIGMYKDTHPWKIPGVAFSYRGDGIWSATGRADEVDLIREVHAPQDKTKSKAKTAAKWTVTVQCASRQDARDLATHIRALHDEDQTLKVGAVRVVKV